MGARLSPATAQDTDRNTLHPVACGDGRAMVRVIQLLDEGTFFGLARVHSSAECPPATDPALPGPGDYLPVRCISLSGR